MSDGPKISRMRQVLADADKEAGIAEGAARRPSRMLGIVQGDAQETPAVPPVVAAPHAETLPPVPDPAPAPRPGVSQEVAETKWYDALLGGLKAAPGLAMEAAADAGRAGAQAISSYFSDEAAAPLEAAKNKVAAGINQLAPLLPKLAESVSANINPAEHPVAAAVLRAPAALAAEATPIAAGRGVNAPLVGEAEALAEMRSRNAAADERSPIATTAAKVGGGMIQGAAIPVARAAQGAGALQRLLATGANVVGDSLLGGAATAGVSEAPTLRGRLEDGAEGAKWAGGLSALLRSGPHVKDALKWGGEKALGAANAAQMVGYSDEARLAADELLAPGAQGADLRAAALRGEAGVDEAARVKVREGLGRFEKARDRVLADDSTGVAMKAGPVADSVRKSGEALSPSQGTYAGLPVRRAEEQALEVADDVDRLVTHWRENPDFYQSHGAMRRAEKALGAFSTKIDKRFQTPEDAGELYVALDQLKRSIGGARNAAEKGGDQYTRDALEDLYSHSRRALENSEVWGEVASRMQREVNPAWEEYMLTRPMYEQQTLVKRGLSDVRAADGWNTVPQADPGKLKSGLSASGTEDAYLFDRALDKHIPASTNLARTLTEWYESPQNVKGVVESMQGEADALSATIGGVRKDQDAARKLRTLRDVAKTDDRLWQFAPLPSPATQATWRGRMERLGDSPKMRAIQRLADGPLGDMVRSVPRGAAAALAPQLADPTRMTPEELAQLEAMRALLEE